MRSDIRPLKQSNIRYQTPEKNQIPDITRSQKSDIWLKKSYIRPQKKSIIRHHTPLKKIKYQISRYPRSTPPPPPLYMLLSIWSTPREWYTSDTYLYRVYHDIKQLALNITAWQSSHLGSLIWPYQCIHASYFLQCSRISYRFYWVYLADAKLLTIDSIGFFSRHKLHLTVYWASREPTGGVHRPRFHVLCRYGISCPYRMDGGFTTDLDKDLCFITGLSACNKIPLWTAPWWCRVPSTGTPGSGDDRTDKSQQIRNIIQVKADVHA